MRFHLFQAMFICEIYIKSFSVTLPAAVVVSLFTAWFYTEHTFEYRSLLIEKAQAKNKSITKNLTPSAIS